MGWSSIWGGGATCRDGKASTYLLGYSRRCACWICLSITLYLIDCCEWATKYLAILLSALRRKWCQSLWREKMSCVDVVGVGRQWPTAHLQWTSVQRIPPDTYLPLDGVGLSAIFVESDSIDCCGYDRECPANSQFFSVRRYCDMKEMSRLRRPPQASAFSVPWSWWRLLIVDRLAPPTTYVSLSL